MKSSSPHFLFFEPGEYCVDGRDILDSQGSTISEPSSAASGSQAFQYRRLDGEGELRRAAPKVARCRGIEWSLATPMTRPRFPCIKLFTTVI